MSELLAAEAGAAMKVAYPAIVVAWKSVGSRPRASQEDEQLAADWAAVGNLLADIDGHGGHGGWSFDPATQVMQCACGAPMYGAAGLAASPAGYQPPEDPEGGDQSCGEPS